MRPRRGSGGLPASACGGADPFFVSDGVSSSTSTVAHQEVRGPCVDSYGIAFDPVTPRVYLTYGESQLVLRIELASVLGPAALVLLGLSLMVLAGPGRRSRSALPRRR
ncbi:MAG: hypothetical protein ACE5FG_03200 [Myxococcota bacterium]